jgi:HlyD family secretion protein
MAKILKFVLILAGVGLMIFLYEYLGKELNKPLVGEGFAYGNGRIEATEVAVAPKISGRISEIFVQEGDIVEKGQAVATLETQELQARLELSQAQIKQAQENEKYARAVLEQAQSELSLAQKNYKRAKELYHAKAVSLVVFEQEETRYLSASAAAKAAEANVAQADEAIHVAQAQLQTVRVSLDESTLRAPIKGRVLYKLAQNGEVVGSGQNVLILLDLLDTYMSVFLSTAEAGRVDFDSEARIVLDAFSDIAIPARITFISPKAQFTPKQIETKEEREKLMFRVKVNIDPLLLEKHLQKVKTGLPGMAYIRLDPAAHWPEALRHMPKGYETKAE